MIRLPLDANRMLRAAGAAVLLLALCACAPLPPAGASRNEEIWQARPGRFVPFDDLVQQARAADIVLLGETHDNAAHHALQARLFAALADARPGPALVMEQFDFQEQSRLDAVRGSDASPELRLAALKLLMQPGWDWDAYQPLLAIAVERRLQVVAANISREALRRGVGGLGEGEPKRLGLTSGWSNAQQAQLSREIADSHCDALPPAAVTAMSAAQRTRDAVMADRLLSVRSGVAVAILGRGHVRQDLAVPWYLQQRSPKSKVLAIALVEGAPAGAAELAHGPLGQRYDYVISTEAAKRSADPCAGFAPRAPVTQ
ncbi:MAG: ChaN family lipoprotein [Noviherbaspirillum sp.]